MEHEIILKTKEELRDAVGQAVSIGANNQPEDPAYIGSCQGKYGVCHYYRDTDGSLYYESSRTIVFDREMQEAQKRRKAKCRCGRKK